MDLKTADKQEILATFDLKDPPRSRADPLNRRIEVLKVSRQIDERTREAFDERQKEAVLRERLRQIQKELGETDNSERGTRGSEEGRQGGRHAAGGGRAGAARTRPLERMPDGAAEYSMTRTYLDWLIAMPWSKLDPNSSTSTAPAPSSMRIITGSRR
jgi:ATP-dependent Lon protease